MTNVYLTRLDSPIGRLELTADDDAVTGLSIERDGALPHDGEPEQSNAVLDEARRQLTEYFAGERRDFDLPLRPAGAPFQLRVWEQLLTVPYGETASYGEIAAELGAPTASRAVGAANGRNPIAIVVPCHRVIGALVRLPVAPEQRLALAHTSAARPASRSSSARFWSSPPA